MASFIVSSGLKVVFRENDIMAFEMANRTVDVADEACGVISSTCFIHVDQQTMEYLPELDYRYLVSTGIAENVALLYAITRAALIGTYRVQLSRDAVKFVNSPKKECTISKSSFAALKTYDNVVVRFFAHLSEFYCILAKVRTRELKAHHLHDTLAMMISGQVWLGLGHAVTLMNLMENCALAPVTTAWLAVVLTNCVATKIVANIIALYDKQPKKEVSEIAKRLLVLKSLLEHALQMCAVSRDRVYLVTARVALSLGYADDLLFRKDVPYEISKRIPSTDKIPDLDEIISFFRKALAACGCKSSKKKMEKAAMESIAEVPTPQKKVKALVAEMKGNGSLRRCSELDHLLIEIEQLFQVDY
jgi:hypothetical protein